MGASLAVILANLWMKSFEKALQKPNDGRENKTPDTKVICIDCNRCVTLRWKGVECELCKNWFQAKCHNNTNREYKTPAGHCLDLFRLCGKRYQRGHTGIEIIQEVCR